MDQTQRDEFILSGSVESTDADGGDVATATHESPRLANSSANGTSDMLKGSFTASSAEGPHEGSEDLAEDLRRASNAARALADRLESAAQRSTTDKDIRSAPQIRAFNQRLQSVREAAESAGGIEELAALDSLLSAWADKPSDLLIMVKVAEEAGLLGRIVRSHAEILRLLEDG